LLLFAPTRLAVVLTVIVEPAANEGFDDVFVVDEVFFDDEGVVELVAVFLLVDVEPVEVLLLLATAEYLYEPVFDE
jgi:hypothetical protein